MLMFVKSINQKVDNWQIYDNFFSLDQIYFENVWTFGRPQCFLLIGRFGSNLANSLTLFKNQIQFNIFFFFHKKWNNK